MQHITKINGEVWMKEYEVALCVCRWLASTVGD